MSKIQEEEKCPLCGRPCPRDIVIPSATISDGVGFKADKSCCNAQHNALLLSLGREKRYLYNYNTIQCMFALCVFVSRCLHGQRLYIVLYCILYCIYPFL